MDTNSIINKLKRRINDPSCTPHERKVATKKINKLQYKEEWEGTIIQGYAKRLPQEQKHIELLVRDGIISPPPEPCSTQKEITEYIRQSNGEAKRCNVCKGRGYTYDANGDHCCQKVVDGEWSKNEMMN